MIRIAEGKETKKLFGPPKMKINPVQAALAELVDDRLYRKKVADNNLVVISQRGYAPYLKSKSNNIGGFVYSSPSRKIASNYVYIPRELLEKELQELKDFSNIEKDQIM